MEAMNYESRNKFPTREEINDIIKEINGKIDSLRISEATLAGKASQSAVNIVTFISVAGIVIAIVAVIIHFV
jgi:pyruvate kinase